MPKCLVCKKTLKQAEAVPIHGGKKTVYSCQEHVQEAKMRVAIDRDLIYILDPSCYSLIVKFLIPLIEKEGIEKSRAYLQETKEYWQNYMRNKNFNSSFHKVAYFKKIMEDKLHSYNYKEEKITTKVNQEENTVKTIIPQRKRRKPLNEILGGA